MTWHLLLMNVNQPHFSAPCEEGEDCVRLSTESLMHCIHETNKIIIFEGKFISQFALLLFLKTASGYHYKIRKRIQLTVQTVQRPRRCHGLPAAEYGGFTEHHPETGSCVFVSSDLPFIQPPVINQGHSAMIIYLILFLKTSRP